MTQEESLKLMKIGENVFITGPAGSGKTYVINQYIEYLDQHGIEVAVTASTGIAATHIGGQTIHSWSGIGIKDHLTEYDLELMEEKKYLWTRYQKTKVLIIDEISMISSHMLTMIDQVCRHMKRNSEPFGGMQVIFSGDFFQLPPIIRRRPESQELFEDENGSVGHFAFSSPSWEESNIHICYLTTQYRQKDSKLLNILQDMRSGSISKESRKQLESRIIPQQDQDVTRLYTHNINVDSFNEQRLKALDGEEKVFTMVSKGKPMVVDGLKRGCLSPERLVLKIGAQVMFVKNNPVQGYVNGTTGKVISFKDNVPVVETGSGEIYTALPQTWSIEDEGKTLAEIAQVPLRLAWAITVHKSQGMTLDRACMDLSKAFEKGQGYVALSRVENIEGLHLLGFNDEALQVHPDILGRDEEFKISSENSMDHIKNMSIKDIEQHMDNFKEIHGDKKNTGKNSASKKTTFEKTKDLILQKMTPSEIADDRDISQDTVIEHIEKLLDESMLSLTDIEYLKPKDPEGKNSFNLILKSFKKQDDKNLKPVFEDLNKKYNYDHIKFVRLFVR